MELLFILSVLFISGFFIVKKSYDYDFLGFVICLKTGVYFFLHILLWSLCSYGFNKFVTKRQAFVETLDYARKNKSKFELASITREVSEWNQELASSKYDNNVFLLKDYIDDRISTLEPIR
jgi:hypothetical protein